MWTHKATDVVKTSEKEKNLQLSKLYLNASCENRIVITLLEGREKHA